MRTLPALLLLGTAAGCSKAEDKSRDSETRYPSYPTLDEYYEPGGRYTPAVAVEWGSTSVELSIAGGPGAWKFGMAETDGCDVCWTGEDCWWGYETSGGLLTYCHDSSDTGTTLIYGGDAYSLSSGATVFNSAYQGARVTYLLESDLYAGGDGLCWVWGDDTSYYDGFGCTSL